MKIICGIMNKNINNYIEKIKIQQKKLCRILINYNINTHYRLTVTRNVFFPILK